MISSFRSKPAVTPWTMLATSARTSPCSAFSCRASPSLVTTTWPFSTATATPSGTSIDSVPLEPLTETLRPFASTLTPEGTATGILPIRDIRPSLVDFAEDFAADPADAGGAVAHDAAARAQHVDSHPAQHGTKVVDAAIDATARLAHPADRLDDLFAVGAVLQLNPQRLARFPRNDFELNEEAFLNQHFADFVFDLRIRH